MITEVTAGHIALAGVLLLPFAWALGDIIGRLQIRWRRRG